MALADTCCSWSPMAGRRRQLVVVGGGCWLVGGILGRGICCLESHRRCSSLSSVSGSLGNEFERAPSGRLERADRSVCAACDELDEQICAMAASLAKSRLGLAGAGSTGGCCAAGCQRPDVYKYLSAR